MCFRDNHTERCGYQRDAQRFVLGVDALKTRHQLVGEINNRSDAAAYVERGNKYRNKGEYDRAIDDYGEAIRLNPQFVAAFNYLGIAYASKGQHDRAIADYDEAIRLDPKDAVSFCERGNAYRNQNANTTARSSTTTRRSGSIRKMPSPSTAAGLPTPVKAYTTVQSRTTTRRSGSIQISLGGCREKE